VAPKPSLSLSAIEKAKQALQLQKEKLKAMQEVRHAQSATVWALAAAFALTPHTCLAVSRLLIRGGDCFARAGSSSQGCSDIIWSPPFSWCALRFLSYM
jgi:hypothetical protein